MNQGDQLQLLEVFAGSIWEASLIKSMLEDAEIQAYLKDEIWGTYAPWHVAGGGAGAVKVMISSIDYIKAKAIVDGYYENLNNV